MVVIDINTKGITLFSGSMKLEYTYEEFEEIIKKFRKVDSNDLVVSIDYGVEDNSFHYDKSLKDQEVSFEQRGHYIIISKESACDLFEYYETDAEKSRWAIFSYGVLFNGKVYLPNRVIEYINYVDKCFEARSENLIPENASFLFSLKDDSICHFSINQNQITIHAPKNQELKFIREEWNNFYNEWSLS